MKLWQRQSKAKSKKLIMRSVCSQKLKIFVSHMTAGHKLNNCKWAARSFFVSKIIYQEDQFFWSGCVLFATQAQEIKNPDDSQLNEIKSYMATGHMSFGDGAFAKEMQTGDGALEGIAPSAFAVSSKPSPEQGQQAAYDKDQLEIKKQKLAEKTKKEQQVSNQLRPGRHLSRYSLKWEQRSHLVAVKSLLMQISCCSSWAWRMQTMKRTPWNSSKVTLTQSRPVCIARRLHKSILVVFS